MGARGLAIRDDVPVAELRRLARREPDRAAAARMYVIANALEGMSRVEAVRLAGMERQALQDAAVRFNTEGLVGLSNRPHSCPAPRLEAARRVALKQLVLGGPDVEEAGVFAWTLPYLCREVKQLWGIRLHPSHMGKLLQGLGLITPENSACTALLWASSTARA